MMSGRTILLELTLLRKERVSSEVAKTLIRMDKSQKEQKITTAEVENSTTQDQQQEAMARITGRMMDVQIGQNKWSLWSENSFESKDKLK